jgi:cytochrome c oxidase subunit 2
MPAGRRHGRWLAILATLAMPFVLGACRLPTFFGYRGATTQAHDSHVLFAGTVITAIVVGVIVTLLILWSVFRYRRRSEDMPKQFQYHIPLEITYTVIPIIIVLVLFGFTVVTENAVDAVAPNPAVAVKVTAFQWGWRFDYTSQHVEVIGETTEDPDPVGLNGSPCAPAVDCLGPGLVLPAGQTSRIVLVSADVVHGFYVPAFNFSRYALPGVTNVFDFTVKHPGIYRAQCTQFCGLYHALMFFHVVALPPAQFRAWVRSEQAASHPAPSIAAAKRALASASGKAAS